MFSRNGLDLYRRQEVVAHLAEDSTIRGVLTATYKDCIVLTHISYYNPQPEQVPGEAVIPLEKVVWLQALGSD